MQPPIKPRPLADILAELDEITARQIRVMKAHMSMTSEQHRAAEEKVYARTGNRVFNVEDLVAAHEESNLNAWLPEGTYAVDLEA